MPEKTFRERVEEVLERIRQYLRSEGGDVELVDVYEDEGKVSVRLTGTCGFCPFSQQTLKYGIENELKKSIPEIREVISV